MIPCLPVFSSSAQRCAGAQPTSPQAPAKRSKPSARRPSLRLACILSTLLVPLTALLADEEDSFGSRERTPGTLIGTIYDTNQTADRRPTDISNDVYAKVACGTNASTWSISGGSRGHCRLSTRIQPSPTAQQAGLPKPETLRDHRKRFILLESPSGFLTLEKDKTKPTT
jgi:hypothetical protein